MLIPLIGLLSLQQLPTSATGPTPYWQQRVVYEIDARLVESKQTLVGQERVKYINHSPDTLRTISFHLFLNAFRPGSRWSDADSMERRRRFNDLKDPDFGFNHVRDVKIDGVSVEPMWPFGRDSTVVRFALPRALSPGDSLVVNMDWDARPSIPPRRQGRRGRSYDFAQWYPKVVVYDKYGWEEHPLYPAGEFYGEFGDFYVDLNVPLDQVVGATGEPVCGDPGWSKANQVRSHPVDSDFGITHSFEYDGVTTGGGGSGVSCGDPETELEAHQDVGEPTRKEILWVAHDVHNFAMSMSPDYRYEGGEWNGIQVHVLYQPGDEKTWGGGIVVKNTINTLKWLNFVFGPYPWPQMTVVHRIEGGGTEFPMMQMNGSPSQGLNLHEGGHSYLMGILANNEWKEGWLDEGFTSFQTTWYQEVQAHNDGAVRALESGILMSDLDGESQPVSTVSDKFRDFGTYNNMIYSRGELFLHELKRLVGDSTMLEILHRYYARWKLHHVDEDAFRAVAEEVSHRDLKTFFAQWLHEVDLTDYAIRGARRQSTPSGWQSTIDIARHAPGQFPITVAVYAEHDTAYARAEGIAELERITITTRTKPRRVILDPFVVAHDWNMLNNEYQFGWLRGRHRPTQTYLDRYFSPRSMRDKLTVGIMPTLWYNDVGGITIGYHTRSDYLGRFEQNTSSLFCGLRRFDWNHDTRTCGFAVALGNPTWWRTPNVSQQLSAFRYEGRTGAAIRVEQVRSPHLGFGPTYRVGGSAQWVATYDLAYLPPTLWDDGGSGEAAAWWGVADTRGNWDLRLLAQAAGGVMYAHPAGGFTTLKRYDAQPYARPEITVTAVRRLNTRTTIGLRGYGAAVFSADPVLSQRRIFIAGADPYQTLSNPFLRSVGALLLRDDCWCRWHTPGGGNLRGYNQSFSTNRLLAVNAEIESTVLRTDRALFSRIGLAVFGDAAWVGSARSIGGIGDSVALPASGRVLADAGAGIRITQRIGATTWTSRVDFPMFVSDPQYAFAHRLTTFGLNRLVLSFSPVIP